MAKYDAKTKPTKGSVAAFLKSIDNEQQREDCQTLIKLFMQVTKEDPVLWGPSMIGFGSYHYKYASGHEGDYFITGFSPRKANLTLYIMCGFEEHPDLMKKLGKYKTGKSCLYIKSLEEIDQSVLKQLIKDGYTSMKKRWG